MKTMISSFSNSVLSREQMKKVKGGLLDPNEGGSSNFYKCCNDQGLSCNACSSEQTCSSGKLQVRC
jgi:hypothetical protein